MPDRIADSLLAISLSFVMSGPKIFTATSPRTPLIIS